MFERVCPVRSPRAGWGRPKWNGRGAGGGGGAEVSGGIDGTGVMSSLVCSSAMGDFRRVSGAGAAPMLARWSVKANLRSETKWLAADLGMRLPGVGAVTKVRSAGVMTGLLGERGLPRRKASCLAGQQHDPTHYVQYGPNNLKCHHHSGVCDSLNIGIFWNQWTDLNSV